MNKTERTSLLEEETKKLRYEINSMLNTAIERNDYDGVIASLNTIIDDYIDSVYDKTVSDPYII